MDRAATAAAIVDIERELATLRADDAVATVVPEVQRLLDAESVLVLTPAESLGGLDVARFDAIGFADPAGLRDAFADVFHRQPLRYAWYDPICPEPAQRNRLYEAHDLIEPGELEQSYIYERALLPFGLHAHHQPRILLCDGASLLAWFGMFHPTRANRRQRRLLACLARPLQRRLALERNLAWDARSAALGAALDHIGAPAFVLAAPHRIVEANAAGRALLETRRADVAEALAAATSLPGTGVAASDLQIDCVPLRERGCPELWLAIVRAGTREARIAACVASAVEHWQLTERQAAILGRIVRGDASPTIAAELGISGRAVELQLTGLFQRTQTTNRTELVAAALLC